MYCKVLLHCIHLCRNKRCIKCILQGVRRSITVEKDVIMYVENVKSQMRKGMLEYCVMLLLSKKSYYSSDIIDELERANLIVVEGTLYPLLSRLKKEALLDYDWQESPSGPPRKYYKLTPEGKAVLEALEESWQQLAGTVEGIKAL